MGQATVRVHVNGFRDLSEQMSVGTDGRHDFELVPVPQQAGSLNGEYRLTVTASPSCVLPADIMQRRYDARVMEVERNLYVLLGGAALSVWGGQPGFTGTRDQSTVRFVVSATFDDGYNFIEQIDSERSLFYSGTAAGIADQSRIVATFSGTLELRAPRRGDAWCVAGDHRFELTRVPAQR